MKPLSIADYLDHLGRPAGEKVAAAARGLAVSPSKPAEPAERRFRPEVGLRSRSQRGRPSAKGRGSPAHAMGAKAGSARVRARSNRRQQASRSRPRTCRSTSPRLMRAAGRKASPKGGSRLQTATRLNSPLRGSRRRLQQQAFRLSEYAQIESTVRSGLQTDRGRYRGRRRTHPRAISLARGPQASGRRTGQSGRPESLQALRPD